MVLLSIGASKHLAVQKRSFQLFSNNFQKRYCHPVSHRVTIFSHGALGFKF